MNGYLGNIETVTVANTHFRKVLYTGQHQQLVVMCLQPKEDIGVETHEIVDQFFRIEEGEGAVLLNGKSHPLKGGDAILIPAGTQHNVINTSAEKPLKLYTVYAPPHHKDAVIHTTKQEAQRDTSDHI